jgi:hypothetical protein
MIPSEFEYRLRWLERRGPLQLRGLDQLQTEAAQVSQWLDVIRQEPESPGVDNNFFGCTCAIPLTDLTLSFKHLARSFTPPASVPCNPTPIETITTSLRYYPAGTPPAGTSSPLWQSDCFLFPSEGDGSSPLQTRYRATFGCDGTGSFIANVVGYNLAVNSGNCTNRSGGFYLDTTQTGFSSIDNVTVRWSLAECTSSPFYVKFWINCSSPPPGSNPGYAEVTQ